MFGINLYNTHIDFLTHRERAMIGSAVLVLFCFGSLLFWGLNLGLDFTGGTVIEVHYPEPVEIPAIRKTLAERGFGNARTQHFGTSRDVLIRVPPREQANAAAISNEILAVLKAAEGGERVVLARAEYVGPQVGEELVEQGGLAMLGALLAILIYVMLRFEWRLAVGTIAAIAHDVIITLGLFSLFQIDFDLTVLAAVLAVIGYSVNDTVVVLDRIRENFRKLRKGTTIEVMNRSINETLARTVMTSITTLIAVIVLYVLGGAVMRGFSIALIIGVVVGTYSSIYIASASALYLSISREDLLPRVKETADERP